MKLKGTGDWPLEEYLDGPLWLPYVEPAVLLHGEPIQHCPVPAFHLEDEKEYWKLAVKWSEMGLLRLHREPHRPGSYVRIFNAFKSAEVDRMIGDRRKVNYMERHLAGSSRFLPAGPMLTGLHLSPGQCLRGSVTDRRDFYHQCAATWERSASQLLPFSFPTSWFDGMDAYEDFKAREQQVPSTRREVVGDRLGFEKVAKKKAEPERLFPAFSALYQGDHLGVEFALGAHEGLLESEGLLQKDERIVGRSSLPWGPVWRGLIIDDFFTITAENEEIPTERTGLPHSGLCKKGL